MTKRIVYQINVPNAGRNMNDKLTAYTYMPDMYEISERNARRYAEKYGADYYKVETLADWKPGKGKHLDFQKLKFLDFDQYDQILYLDSDFIMKNNAPDLFNICGKLSAASVEHSRATPDQAAILGIPAEKYFNAGIIYFTRDTIEKLRPHIEEYINKQEWPWECQGMLNKMFFDLDIKYLNLPSEDWNPIPRCFGRYADHYAGAKKRNWGKTSY
jgi:lipopolysaccharide biosynthesis glycosyltransferase